MTYAGDVTCKVCWDVLESNQDAQLVDVRTVAEWTFVGFPVLEPLGRKTIMVEWQKYPAMDVNQEFAMNVRAALDAIGVGETASIFTLCRSGVRSIAAAQTLTAAGYSQVYNVLGGFEGNPDNTGHRGTVSGWKYDDLPWRQN